MRIFQIVFYRTSTFIHHLSYKQTFNYFFLSACVGVSWGLYLARNRFCRAVGTLWPCFSFSHSSLFPLHCRDVGSKLCCRLTVQINKKRRVSRSSGWGKSIGSKRIERERAREQENSKTEVGRAVGNQVSPKLHVKLTGTVFPGGNDREAHSGGSSLITNKSASTVPHTRPDGEIKKTESQDLSSVRADDRRG